MFLLKEYFYFFKVPKTVVGQCHVISLRINAYFT